MKFMTRTLDASLENCPEIWPRDKIHLLELEKLGGQRITPHIRSYVRDSSHWYPCVFRKDCGNTNSTDCHLTVTFQYPGLGVANIQLVRGAFTRQTGRTEHRTRFATRSGH